MIYTDKIENNKLGNTTPFESVANSLGWTLSFNDDEVEKGYDGATYIKGFAPVEPVKTLSELASTISMTKAEFLLLVTKLTPITLTDIETFINSDDDFKIRFTYANTVERNHPMLETVASMPEFNVSADLLDIMFVNKDELIAKINAGEPIEGI